MKSEPFWAEMQDGEKVFVNEWHPEDTGKVNAVVQIAHGMAEHSGRYSSFAEVLVNAGFAVYAHDHRGHGETAGALENIGYFADENGWELVVEDTHRITEIIKERLPGIPVFLFGHSMGSFISRNYIFLHGEDLHGVILSGTAGDPGLLGSIAILLAKLEIIRKGGKAASPLMNYLTFSDYNKQFRPNRTDFDWLSRDNDEVDKYIEDPFCGGIFSAGLFLDLLRGLKQINRRQNAERIPKDLPIYLMSGDRDPVGKNGKGVLQVFKAFEKTGIGDVDCKLYQGGRHEMLNEINREEVYKDIIEWLGNKLSGSSG